MSDARQVWIFGATSAIAHAYARRRAEPGATFILLGRNEVHLEANAADLIARGAKAVSVRSLRSSSAARLRCHDSLN